MHGPQSWKATSSGSAAAIRRPVSAAGKIQT